MAYEGMAMQWEISKFNLNAVNFMSAHCFPLLQKMLFSSFLLKGALKRKDLDL